MTLKGTRLRRLAVALVLAAGLAASVWVYLAGGLGALSILGKADPFRATLMVAITALCVLVRFVRWQFMLRRLEVRVPIRGSFSMYLASLAGTATPAYVGEAVRAVFMRRRYRVPIRVTLTALVYERLLDFAALATIGFVMVDGPWMRPLMLSVIALCYAVGLSLAAFGKGLGVPASTLARLRHWRNLGPALAMSVLAWGAATLLVSLAASALAQSVPVGVGVRIYSTSTLLGGLSLMPAGAIFAGGSAIVQLEELGLPVTLAVAIVSLMRLCSVGVTFLISGVFLALQVASLREPAGAGAGDEHFDHISHEYAEQFNEHVWNHLLVRKVAMMEGALGGDPARAGRGLDLGCGLGLQYFELQRRGYDVIGLDMSKGLLRDALRRGGRVAAGSALDLPFADASLDFVYCVGVLHHLPGPEAQARALAEVARVLKPGGRFMVHESNPKNPLFRFYMGYVFPVLKSIDEGTEYWIHPTHWSALPGLELRQVQYFTFLPDFIPRALMRPFVTLERWLEGSRHRDLSVHYFAELVKPAQTMPPRGS